VRVACVRQYPVVAVEWAGPVATGVVGLGGIAATYFSGRRQISSIRQVALDQAAASLAAQREERHQRRIETAYPVLLDVLAEGAEWIWRTDAFMTGDTTDDRPPDQPERVKNLAQHGSLTSVWSPEVARLTRELTIGMGKAMSPASRMSYQWETSKVSPNRQANAPISSRC
jgi:hypothetical protein